MTERDYLCYKMNKDEIDKWEGLVTDIKKSFCLIADISEIPLQVFNDVLGRTFKDVCAIPCCSGEN